MNHNIDLPIHPQEFESIALGDVVYLNGTIITARDQAHARIIELNKTGNLPPSFNSVKNSAIYHCGPLIEERENEYRLISAGPTTSQRMDPLENDVVEILGVNFIIGKGGMRNLATEKYRVAYLSYPGGCGAIVNQKVTKITDVEWKDLGLCEAVWFLEVREFGPLIVSQINGESLYEK
jgi:fumarate hydratase subunit beta